MIQTVCIPVDGLISRPVVGLGSPLVSPSRSSRIEWPSASTVRTALLAVVSPGRLIERPSASIVRTALLVVSPGCLMNGSPL